jgi:hypothetical protein
MPENQIAPSQDVQRLIDAGYQVSVEGNYVIVDNVPYVSADGTVSRAALISAYTVVNGITDTGDHTVWFTGSMPCRADGSSLENAIHAGGALQAPEPVAGRIALCRFSNYPDPAVQAQMRTDVSVKMEHYIRKLGSFAAAVENTASASGTRSFHYREEASVFHYPNAAVARAGLDAYEAKLKTKRVAIVGLGGTGAYVLDVLAKTPATEIHLYDDDVIEPHNAYRLPGAVPGSLVTANLRKTDYLKDVYNHIRGGIESHPIRIDAGNIRELDGCSFVFIAVDHGPSRGLIASHLLERGIPFIDVGIGVDKVVETTKLLGRVRLTFIQKENGNAARLLDGLPRGEDADDAIYSNIQLAELNALNAMLAVIKYKQHLEFYEEEIPADALKYTLSWNSLKGTC